MLSIGTESKEVNPTEADMMENKTETTTKTINPSKSCCKITENIFVLNIEKRIEIVRNTPCPLQIAGPLKTVK